MLIIIDCDVHDNLSRSCIYFGSITLLFCVHHAYLINLRKIIDLQHCPIAEYVVVTAFQVFNQVQFIYSLIQIIYLVSIYQFKYYHFYHLQLYSTHALTSILLYDLSLTTAVRKSNKHSSSPIVHTTGQSKIV